MVDPFAHYRDLLAQQGLRVTPQRLLVLRVIDESDDHLTAEAIGKRIAANNPTIHPGTIYRTLETLRAAGLVSETQLGERAAVYEMVAGHPHHHLVCEHCGVTIDADDALLDSVRATLLAHYGFTARANHIAFFGLCQACAAR